MHGFTWRYAKDYKGMEIPVQITNPIKKQKELKKALAFALQTFQIFKSYQSNKNPNTIVSYKRLQTLSTLFTNYKTLAHKSDVEKSVLQKVW